MMQTWPLHFSIVVFPIAAIIIGYAGTKIIKHAEYLAKTTGMGEAAFGAIFMGITTSLPSLITSLSVALEGYASLAFSNALGSIAIQTVSLGFADFAYRKANLEYAAASETNMVQGMLLIVLLTIPLFAVTSKSIAFFNISPFSIIFIVSYLVGLRLIFSAFKKPMWRPVYTRETRPEKKQKRKGSVKHLHKSWLAMVLLVPLISFLGWMLGKAGISLSVHTALNESLIGGVLTAIATSLPGLVVIIASVKSGALNLAIGNIIGGNTFNVLFIGVADFFYRKGSLYVFLSSNDIFWVALDIALTSILLLGLLRRGKQGIVNIGFESALIMILYVGGTFYVFI